MSAGDRPASSSGELPLGPPLTDLTASSIEKTPTSESDISVDLPGGSFDARARAVHHYARLLRRIGRSRGLSPHRHRAELLSIAAKCLQQESDSSSASFESKDRKQEVAGLQKELAELREDRKQEVAGLQKELADLREDRKQEVAMAGLKEGNEQLQKELAELREFVANLQAQLSSKQA